MNIPSIGTPLTDEHVSFLEAFSKSCRRSIIRMVKNSQSGHPGGSLSSIDYLALVYAFIIGQTGEDVIVSNGHISPAVYSVLAEMKYIPKEEMIETFRKIGSIYEGHITRHVKGIKYGTGPLGAGISAASGFALAEKMNKTGKYVYGVLGDGEAQEGQVHEMMNFAHHYKLDNFIVFVDYNKVQLTASLEDTMPINIHGIFEAAGWNVIDVDGHDFHAMWDALAKAHENKGTPTILIGNTIMGQGVEQMEEDGKNHIPTWHGKAPKPDHADEMIETLEMTDEEIALIDTHETAWSPDEEHFIEKLTPIDGFNAGAPIIYPADEVIDCRSAYGKALADLGNKNESVVALVADLKGSVMTKFLEADHPDRHIECGIAEQHMVSCAGGMSLKGFIPFASTFGAFISSRAKDQARVNDINQANVKLVATHCGLSVGEDGPTHQAIDDMGSFLGMYNMHIIEPACPNQTDRIIRFAAGHYGNFYVRMGRHKFPIITKEDGSIYYDENYTFEYGKSDVIRSGDKVTVFATGAMVHETLAATEGIEGVEIIAVHALKALGDDIVEAARKTGHVITVEDHNAHSGLGSQISLHLMKNGVQLESFNTIAPTEYQLSGKANELYDSAGISAAHIKEAIESVI